MKARIFFVYGLIIIAFSTSAQVPQKFNFQAVVRDAQNNLIKNQDVGLKLSILEGSASGSPVYVETHTVTTTGFGLANLVIGDGSVVSGTFGEIPWGSDDYFLKVEVDPVGGSAYEHVGTSQLISVPYALYSGNISSPTKKFTIQENLGHPVDSALFEVRNLEGQTVFAVYPEGTRVYVLDEEAKGKKGGFSVGGYSRTTKGITDEYLRITPDSIRLYIDESDTKGKKGGFSVGGYSRSTKGTSEYFNITGWSEDDVIPGINRVVWYPQRNDFMAGNVLVEDGNDVGENSMAVGYQSQAIGNYSEAFGYQSIARGENSTAIGNQAIAEKTSSFAFGTGAIAQGVNSYAIGSSGVDSAGIPTGNTISAGEQSVALGMGSRAEGFGSVAIGTENKSSGVFSLAMGYQSEASGYYATAVGKNTIASALAATAMGYHTEANDQYATALGRHTLASGNIATAIGYRTDATGSFSTAMGIDSEAAGPSATAMGRASVASGSVSTSMGGWTRASGLYSTAMGYKSIASETTSTAMGYWTTARANSATAMGKYTVASGDVATAMGYRTTARSCNSLAIGRYNDTLTTSSVNSWVSTDPLFIIGNGSSSTSRHNAMMLKKNGETYFPDVYYDFVNTGRTLVIAYDGKIGYISSSRRYKNNITSMEDIGWLFDLRPVNFLYKNDDSEAKQYGLIAEEVEEVNPSFVSYNNDGEPETVSYSQLISPIIKALQDQDKLIKELQEEIELLKKNE